LRTGWPITVPAMAGGIGALLAVSDGGTDKRSGAFDNIGGALPRPGGGLPGPGGGFGRTWPG
jgi:hypothetical protein